jgi:hypothetical protein
VAYKTIDELIANGQEEKIQQATVIAATPGDETDKLKKHKEILEVGVITQEEFDAKKKQLLNL